MDAEINMFDVMLNFSQGKMGDNHSFGKIHIHKKKNGQNLILIIEFTQYSTILTNV